MLCRLETVSLTKKQGEETKEAELKVLHFSMGVTGMDRIKNKFIRGAASVVVLRQKGRARVNLDVRQPRKVNDSATIVKRAKEKDFAIAKC